MYNLLNTTSKSRPYHSVYSLLDRNEGEQPGEQEVTLNEEMPTEPALELTPSVEQPTNSENQAPVYTVIGEPVFPATDTDAITIVLDLCPAPYNSWPNEETEAEENRSPVPRSHHLAPVGWMLTGVALVVAGFLVIAQVIPWFETSATITLVPLTQPVRITLTVHLVTENANPARQQVQGRQLPTFTMSQSKTVATTGRGYQPAQAAQGWLTLYNALPTAQTILEGTLIIGQDGAQVTTDGTVTIPAANAPLEGSAQVSAHATMPGPTGNIVAFDINGPCCRTDVLAKNAASFTGGQNARSYQAVSAQDIQSAVTALQTPLMQDITAAYQGSLADGESLITPVSCSSQVKADHPQDTEAGQVTVSMSEACQGIAYNTAQMRMLVAQAMSQQAQELQGNQAGEGYQLESRSLYIWMASGSTSTGDVQIQADGTLMYQWSQQQQHALAALVAGKSEAQATALLERQPGISTITITLAGRNTGTLPGNPNHIHFAIMTQI